MSLITKIEELKEYNAPANAGIDMLTFLPSCKHIEKKILIPEMGLDLYTMLHEAYQESIAATPTELPEAMADLLAEVRTVLAPLAILHYKHSTIVITSDAGSTERSGQNSEPVRMWVNNLQSETLFNEGMDALEMLLAYLEENKGLYPDWVNSDAYTEFHGLLMQTTLEFDAEVKINKSRRLFKALRPDIKFAELQVIRKNISPEFYDALIEARKDDSLSADEEKVLGMIHAVTANFAIASSSLPVELGNEGAFTLFTDSQFSGYKSSKRKPEPADMEGLRRNYFKRATAYLDDLRAYLDKHASNSKFAEYYNSSCYTAPPANDDDESLNTNLKNIFVA